MIYKLIVLKLMKILFQLSIKFINVFSFFSHFSIFEMNKRFWTFNIFQAAKLSETIFLHSLELLNGAIGAHTEGGKQLLLFYL